MRYSDEEYAQQVKKSVNEFKTNIATLPYRINNTNIDMDEMEANYREKYTEIVKLHELLDDARIPHEFVFDPGNIGFSVVYMDGDEVICDACTHSFSYGHEENLIEIIGLLTPEERRRDEVAGWLTAEDVFQRISNHYNGK